MPELVTAKRLAELERGSGICDCSNCREIDNLTYTLRELIAHLRRIHAVTGYAETESFLKEIDHA